MNLNRDDLIGIDDGVRLRVTIVTMASPAARDHMSSRTYREIELPADDAELEQAAAIGADCYVAKVEGSLGPNLMLACSRSRDLRDLNAFARQLEAAPPSAPVVADAQLGRIRRPPTMADAMAAVNAADSAPIEVSPSRAAVSMGPPPGPPPAAALLREEAERKWRRERMGERRREQMRDREARAERAETRPAPPPPPMRGDGMRLER